MNLSWKILLSIIISIMFVSCLVLSDVYAQDCMGGQFCGGKSSFTFMDGKNVAVNLKLYSNSTMSNNVHYLWLQFFDKNTNQTIQNVSFFLNATKDDKILIHSLFYTKTGSMTMKFFPSKNMDEFIVNVTSDPVLGGWMSETGTLPITTSAFAEKGTYHIHLEVLALYYENGLVDQNNPPKFDSWWSVDDKGNITQYDNSTIYFGSTTSAIKIKDDSPLKQFKSGIATKDVKCKEGLQRIMKNEMVSLLVSLPIPLMN